MLIPLRPGELQRLIPAVATGTQTTVGATAETARSLTFWEELKRRKVYNVGAVYIAKSRVIQRLKKVVATIDDTLE